MAVSNIVPEPPPAKPISTQQLKSKTLKGLFWSLSERIGQQGMQFIIQLILARLLLPKDFGLIGMLVVFISIGQAIADFGFGNALIQKQDANHTDECSIFYFNILIGAIAAGSMCLAAPWVAAFYHQPLLTPMMRLLTLNILFNAFGQIQFTLLTKHIDFKTQFKRSMTATLLSGIVGISLACCGFGAWSLVFQSISRQFFNMVALWWFSTWYPSLIFSMRSLRTMFTFGSKMLCSSLLDAVFTNLNAMVIGRISSPADMGFYTRADALQKLPVVSITNVVERVTFPVYATIQHDKTLLLRVMRKSMTTLVLGIFPVMIGMAVAARPLIQVLLTAKWLPSVPYLQMLCMAGLIFPLHVINLNVLMAQGRSDLFLRLEVIKKSMMVFAIMITCHFGIRAIVIGQVTTTYLAYLVNTYYSWKFLNYPFWQQVTDLRPYFLTSLLMGAAMFAIGLLPFPNAMSALITQMVVGGVIYLALCRLFRLAAFMSLLQMVQKRHGK